MVPLRLLLLACWLALLAPFLLLLLFRTYREGQNFLRGSPFFFSFFCGGFTSLGEKKWTGHLLVGCGGGAQRGWSFPGFLALVWVEELDNVIEGEFWSV